MTRRLSPGDAAAGSNPYNLRVPLKLCPKCRQAAAFARYLKSEKGRAAVERYRKSEKWQAAVRGQKKQAKERAAEKRAEQQWEAGVLPGMRLCRNGLHQYPVAAPKVYGTDRCLECHRAQRARYRSSPVRRAARVRNRLTDAARTPRARYRRSAKGRAAAARYRLKRRTRTAPADAQRLGRRPARCTDALYCRRPDS
jgi:hypothetical protein